MKRLHVHVAVEDLSQAIQFYSTLFAADPAVVKDDYAKWMLDDPRVNFAISMRGRKVGLDHLGIQVETADELEEVYRPPAQSGSADPGRRQHRLLLREVREVLDRRSAGISWEAFRTTGESTFYGQSAKRADGVRLAGQAVSANCCAAAGGRRTQARVPLLLRASVHVETPQCAVPVHAQFRALGHSGMRHEPPGRRQVQGV